MLAVFSTRAKWRSFLSARRSVLKKYLTVPTLSEMPTLSAMQLRVFGFGLFQDGDVGVGVFPALEQK
jgi:hypothetical protein